MNYCLNSNNQTLKHHSNPPPPFHSLLLACCLSVSHVTHYATPSAPSSLHSGLSRLIVS